MSRGHVLLQSVVVVMIGVGCDRPDDLATPTIVGPDAGAPLHPIEVHRPPSLEAIRSGETDQMGRPVGIDCMTCHSVREEHEVPTTDSVEGLEGVHRGMFYRHGALACSACHDPARADRLRLADGTSIGMTDALRLCSQCHGQQARDWEAGSHGGLRGHWDRRVGPATKNHCVDCHDPHNPRFPVYQPLPPPRDRFLTAERGGHDG